MSTQTFSPKAPPEHVVLTFDFTNLLEADETLTDVVSVNVVARVSPDPNPTAILGAGAVIDETGKKFYQPVTGGLNGVDYVIYPLMDTSNPMKRIMFSATLPVRL